ncbi:MAG: T9SS type A sorting domain-containing protein [Bacteroidota bacterium]|nr:T9SS type A sorting domain-containing protein [Bacteroidota bacterium]MDP4236037.1 T9SS type A sorting domain-containing protein [Bacteroidota bacterium]
MKYTSEIGFLCCLMLICGTSAHTEAAETILPYTVTCMGDFTRPGKRAIEPLSIQQRDTCDRWHAWVGVGGQQTQQVYLQQYDTLRHYIESCGKNDDSYDAFPALDVAVYMYIPNDTSRYDRYRDWLISVLYLNTTQPAYFCACVQSIAKTYGYGKYNIPNAWFAIINYLLTNPHCNTPGLRQEYQQDSIDRHNHWLEGDRSIPEDTTLPSLERLGLGLLLTHSAAPSSGSLSSNQYLVSFTTSPNPFTKETTLQFTLNRMTYATIEVYDELGRRVWGAGKGLSLDAGTHSITIDGKNLPIGTLYARISTGFGEVKTVKLIHE